MIAAARRRANIARVRLEKLTRDVDRAVDRRLVKHGPALARSAAKLRTAAANGRRRAGRRLRPLAARGFRVLSRVERALLRARDLGVAAATAASARLTPRRATCAAILAAAVCLLVAQFADYRAIEIGQPGYAGLEAAPPTRGAEAAGQAHAYMLVPLAAIAAALAILAAATDRRRLGRPIAALGVIALAVVLLIDMPTGLDAGDAVSRYAGAEAVLGDGFYAELAGAAGLIVGGLLLSFPLPRGARARPASAGERTGRRPLAADL